VWTMNRPGYNTTGLYATTVGLPAFDTLRDTAIRVPGPGQASQFSVSTLADGATAVAWVYTPDPNQSDRELRLVLLPH